MALSLENERSCKMDTITRQFLGYPSRKGVYAVHDRFAKYTHFENERERRDFLRKEKNVPIELRWRKCTKKEAAWYADGGYGYFTMSRK